MDKQDRVYVQLQRHMDGIGLLWPATPSKSELRILKHLFTPQQAEVCSYLSYRPEPVETIYPRVKHLVGSPEELSGILEAVQRNGGIGILIREGKACYCNMPLYPGMMEMQVGRFTPDLVQDFEQYSNEMNFGLAAIAATPPIRTIPIARSISPRNKVATFDQLAELVAQAEPPIIVEECLCRQKASLLGHPCKATDRKEMCIHAGTMGQSILRCGVGRVITKDEALEILATNQDEGLVPVTSNTQKLEILCSCCGCCCDGLRALPTMPKPLDWWISNFQSVIDTSLCNGCGVCQKRCQVGAVSVPGKDQPAVVDLKRCIGCGICVAKCPKKAVSLREKPAPVKPPITRDDLQEILKSKKKGTMGLWGVQAKFVFDAIRTGQTHLLKSQQPKYGGPA